MAELKPANENPWYVLMTLHGEYVEGHDGELAAKNTRLWNIWSCQNLSDAEREDLRSKGSKIPGKYQWADSRGAIEALYEKAMKERNSENFEVPDLPEPSVSIDMRNTNLSLNIVLEEAVFAQSILFGFSRFTGSANFRRTIFLQDASFFSAAFLEEAMFDLALFSRRTSFRSASFKGKASVEAASFESRASFRLTMFEEDSNFYATQFLDDVSFENSFFSKNSSFQAASFQKDSSFEGASFSEFSSFNSASFAGVARFSRSKFGVDTSGRDACQSDFRDAIFSKQTTFREAHFNDLFPMFSGTVFYERTQFTAKEGYWPSGSQPNPELAKDACAALRHVVARQSLPEAEYFFFRLEMKFSGQSGPWLSRPIYWFYGFVSDYGYSVGRPATSIALLWLLGFVVFQGCGGDDAFCVVDPPQARLLSSADAAGFSASNIFKFFGFQRTYFADELKLIEAQRPGLLNLAAFQTVLGYILLFFLGLGLRARFRLR